MTDALAQAQPAGAGQPPRAICRSRWAWPWLVLLVVLFHAFGTHPLRAHDIIDTDQANDLVAAADAAAARVKTAAGSGAEGEARFALGMALAEATAVLNRDLAAHNGRLTVNAELVLKSLAQRDMAPAFDEAIGRYRLPRASLADAVRLAPDAPYALQARFELVKAGFYESFVIDPFELMGIKFDDLEHQIAEAVFHDEKVRNVKAKRVQCDEIWSFCYAKQKNVKGAKAAPANAGDVWTWTGLDADSKLVISYFVGGRDSEYAMAFMDDLRSRLATRVQLTTDGHRAYLEAVEGAFGADVDYAMLVKLYGESPEAEKRYSPAECIGCRKTRIAGNPDLAHVSTSYTERHNLTMRMQMRRFTRLTNAFSRKIENHEHMVALYTVWYNWIRTHKAHRMTPAMAAGLTDKLMEMEDVVRLIDDQEMQAIIEQRVAALALPQSN